MRSRFLWLLLLFLLSAASLLFFAMSTSTKKVVKHQHSEPIEPISCQTELESFTILTWNVWFGTLEQKKRYQTIIEETIRLSPTILCFQEATPYFLSQLHSNRQITDDYHFSDDGTENTLGSYGVLLLWKKEIPEISLQFITLPTRMSRKLLLFKTSFSCKEPFWIGTVHLESMKPNAGKREAQLNQITDHLRMLPGPSVLVGDFNFCSTWSGENKNIPDDFLDVWAALRGEENGWTEDTKINIMRYNQKMQHKQVRFDRVLLRSPPEHKKWNPTQIQLIGTAPVDGEHEIWPSDHFGLFTSFTLL